MSELKPCPFCDGRTTVKTRYIGYGSLGLGSHDEYRVVCQECRASSDEYRHEAEAIAAWNRRAGKDTNVATIDAAPVVRGEWIAEQKGAEYCEFRCSACDGSVGQTDQFDETEVKQFSEWYKYCPACGAKMENESK